MWEIVGEYIPQLSFRICRIISFRILVIGEPSLYHSYRSGVSYILPFVLYFSLNLSSESFRDEFGYSL